VAWPVLALLLPPPQHLSKTLWLRHVGREDTAYSLLDLSGPNRSGDPLVTAAGDAAHIVPPTGARGPQ